MLSMALVLVGIGGGAQAQRVYKHVGPDGKVTFTDQAPAGQAPAPATPSDPAAGKAAAPTEPAQAGGPSKHGAKKALPREKTQTEAAPDRAEAKAPIDPALEKGVLVLMGYESIVVEFMDVCPKTLPTSYKKYDAAAQKWRDRHATLLARYPAVLRDFYSPAEQSALRSGTTNRTRGMMANIYTASSAAKIKWCDTNTDELDQGKLDMTGKDHFAQPILNYRSSR